MQRECEASLHRLGVEWIDLFQFHWPDQSGTPIEDSWEAMTRLVEAGQPPLSLIRRQVADSEIPWCAAHKTGVIGYSPLQSGLLTDRFSEKRVESMAENDWRRRSPDFRSPRLGRILALRDALRPVAERHGTTVSALAIAWTLAWPRVTGAIVGARSPEQVDGWIGAATLELSPEDLDEIARAIGRGAGAGPALPK